MNRKVLEQPPRGHVGEYGADFDGCKNEDRKVGVVACFMNKTQTRKNKHLWCVCNLSPLGHWVSTQGQPQVHPKALKNGDAISSTKKKFHKQRNPPTAAAQCKPKAAASSSSTRSTPAEADSPTAKENIDDLHQQAADHVTHRDHPHPHP